jgi:hypothetical protein
MASFGAVKGEKCSLCGTEMTERTVRCRHCGAERELQRRRWVRALGWLLALVGSPASCLLTSARNPAHGLISLIIFGIAVLLIFLPGPARVVYTSPTL